MPSLNVKQLLEAGVHFGHQTRHWNPKMEKYIFGERNGIYIIDLEKTMAGLEKACQFLRETAEKGGLVLMVCTKKQGQDNLKNAALKCGMPYVHQRWLGGMLTNFETIRKSITRLESLEKMEAEGTYQFFTKKEVAHMEKERAKLNKVLEGVRRMTKLPQAVFIVDPGKEDITLKEASRLGIPIVALIDTNTDPDLVDYIIPGNDDAIRSIALICEIVSSALQEGRERFVNFKAQEEAKALAEVQAQVEAAAAREREAAAVAAQAQAKADQAKEEEAQESATLPEEEEVPLAPAEEIAEEVVKKLSEEPSKPKTPRAKTRKGPKARE